MIYRTAEAFRRIGQFEVNFSGTQPNTMIKRWYGHESPGEPYMALKSMMIDKTPLQLGRRIFTLVRWKCEYEPETNQHTATFFLKELTDTDGTFVLSDQLWRVQYKGGLIGATWTQKGPAEAYLELLKKGAVKPHYSDGCDPIEEDGE